MSSRPWYAPLEALRSRGSLAARPGSLAGLHAARRAHVGQFFSPPALVEWLWRLIRPLQEASRGKLTVLDNAAGVGRMFWPADPAGIAIHAVDVDATALTPFVAAATAAGFEIEALNAGMEDIEPGAADLALINPPFGLQLQSKLISDYPGITGWGHQGPLTAAPSVPYAIAQALQACPVVVAVVPHSFSADSYPVLAERRALTLQMPTRLFADQGTDVRVDVLVFGPEQWDGAPRTLQILDLDQPPPSLPFPLMPGLLRPRAPSLKQRDLSLPSITLPVTGDATVRINHDGRKLLLGFACGLVEARVRNGLLRAIAQPPEKHRLPRGVEFAGQGWFDLENLLSSKDPLASFDSLQRRIEGLGGKPAPSASLVGYLKRRVRRDRVKREPLRRWILADAISDLAGQPAGVALPATARRNHVSDPTRWGSPIVRTTDALRVVPEPGGAGRVYAVLRGEDTLRRLSAEEAQRDYEISLPTTGRGWTLLHPGRREAFPELATQLRARAERRGVTRFLGEWGYQLDDILELALADRGTMGWSMGLGKTRASIGLALLGGEHNLICVAAHLVDEYLAEFAKIGLDGSLWQVITRPEQCLELRQVNVIAYSRLKMPVCEGAGRRTYARLLRRRLHTVIADEGHIVRNRQTSQTQALWQLSPKRRYAMSGTPAANYARDALPLMIWAGADGTAVQAFGEHHPYITPQNLQTMNHAQRGVDVWKCRHVTLEWAVRDFEEDLRTGAKREVPKLRNVEAFREALAPHILRRVVGEPEVAAHVRIPTASRHVHTLEWDWEHLKAYVRCADQFADWYRKAREQAGARGQAVNLITLLARIQAVFLAANAPEQVKGPGSAFGGETAKHRAALDLIRRFTREGRQTMLVATNPVTLRRIERCLAKDGTAAVVYDGTVAISRRNRELGRFKRGEAPVLLATYGAAQLGLNLPMGSRWIAYNRDWTPRSEEQALARLLRPQQTQDVEAHYLHLRGSIDQYQAMLVAQKQDAIGAGIDYDDQMMLNDEFLHLDTVLWRFVEQLADDLGFATQHALREQLVA